MHDLTGDKRFVREKPDDDGSIHQVWQEGFKAFPLYSGWMIWQKMNYIYNNPVRAKLGEIGQRLQMVQLQSLLL